MENEDLIGVRRNIRLEPVADPAPRTALAKALDRDVDDPSIDAILKNFEKHLSKFLYNAFDATGIFLIHPRISEARVTAALSKANAFAKALSALNQTERTAVRRLIYRKLNPESKASGVSKHSIEKALELCSKFSFTKSQITKPETIIHSGRSGFPSDPAYEPFVAAILEMWRDQRVVLDRSRNEKGVLNLTRLLASCFSAELTVLDKFDGTRKVQLTKNPRKKKDSENMSEISKTLDAHIVRFMRHSRG